MEENKYNPKQKETLTKIKRIIGELIEIEELQKRKYQRQIGLQDYMDASEADLLLDFVPPYHVLEEKLRESITQARNIGLSKDPLVEKVGEIAFA